VIILNNYYIYIWRLSDQDNSGQIFYVGQGKYRKGILERTRCARAYSVHNRISNSKKRILAFCQLKANKLKLEGTPHIVEILKHNLTMSEANELEIELIKKLGRKFNNTGVLYNISEGGDINPMNDENIKNNYYNAIQNIDRSNQSMLMKNKMSNPEEREKLSKMTFEKMNNPEYKRAWLEIFKTEENMEKIKQIQSDISGVKLTYNGIVYRSKKELARHLNISSQLLNFRLKNNIPLNCIVDKRNVFSKKKGATPSEYINTSYNKCCGCGEIKDKLLFAKNSSSSTGVRSNCKKCELGKRKKSLVK
jgi:hypothetical protein